MIGSRDQPQDLSLAQTSLRCSPDKGDVGVALPVGVSKNLSTKNFEGDALVAPALLTPRRVPKS